MRWQSRAIEFYLGLCGHVLHIGSVALPCRGTHFQVIPVGRFWERGGWLRLFEVWVEKNTLNG